MARAIRFEFRAIGPNTMFANVLAGDKGCPRGHAQRRIRIAVSEIGASGGKLVDAGGNDVRVSSAAEAVAAKLIGVYEDDVWLVSHCLCLPFVDDMDFGETPALWWFVW
jgi:hypothetical protein